MFNSEMFQDVFNRIVGIAKLKVITNSKKRQYL